jgi:hypothetical protein
MTPLPLPFKSFESGLMSDPHSTPTPPDVPAQPPADDTRPTEIGGRSGPEPTRYGDWEKNGRCIDF